MCSGDLVLPVSIHYNFKIHPENEKKIIYIGCLGGPRRSKGIFTIPKIIKELRKYFRVNKEEFKITFIIQLSKDKNKRTFLFKANEFLTRYISNSVKVKYVFGAEDNQEFISLLKSIDIFLLPYSNIQYKYTGSGFITDAIFLEKPIINRKGTSMKDLVRFDNAISVDTASEYSSAIIKISKNYEYYVKNSKAAKKYLINKINNSFKFISEGS
jgi:glycosyltransferase involved in cell wall biosynthesis